MKTKMVTMSTEELKRVEVIQQVVNGKKTVLQDLQATIPGDVCLSICRRTDIFIC